MVQDVTGQHMSERTSSGIVAIWRAGEVRNTSALPLATQERLQLLGSASVRALAAGIFEAANFNARAEWHHPHDNYLADSRLAWTLGVISAQCPSLNLGVLAYRNASDRNVFNMQAGLRVGFSHVVAEGRELAGVEHPERDGLREHARTVAMGQLHTPVPGWDVMTPEALHELLRDPPLPQNGLVVAYTAPSAAA